MQPSLKPDAITHRVMMVSLRTPLRNTNLATGDKNLIITIVLWQSVSRGLGIAYNCVSEACFGGGSAVQHAVNALGIETRTQNRFSKLVLQMMWYAIL